jgi:starch-binding outer membrane protein, SusD/RagB family
MTHITRTVPARRSRSARAAAAAAAAAALLAALGACNTDKILKVDDPGAVQPGSLNNAGSLPAVLNAAIGNFATAYAGNAYNEGLILTSGLLADEWRNSDTFGTRIEVDQRNVEDNNSTMQDVFRLAQAGRASAEQAADAFARLAPDDAGRAQALSLSGFAATLFAEDYCSGTPFSTVDASGTFHYGAPLTTEQMLDTAVARFDTALAVATAAGDDEQVNLAHVGRARALLDLGRFAEAGAEAAPVPDDFVYLVAYSANTSRENNGVWEFNENEGRWSVADREGGNGLPYRSANDPRVLWAPVLTAQGDTDVGFDGETPLFLQEKYPDRDADVPLATGVEARLIDAEAALQAANTGAFLAGLNAARAQLGMAEQLTASDARGGRDAQVDLLFRERGFDLWLTSHRLGDLRRLARQYGRPVESVFPTGPFPKGGTYGTDTSFPVPVDERNNPEFAQLQSCDNSVP